MAGALRKILKQDAEREGKAGEVGFGGFGEGVEAENVDGGATAGEGGGGVKGIGMLVAHIVSIDRRRGVGPREAPRAKIFGRERERRKAAGRKSLSKIRGMRRNRVRTRRIRTARGRGGRDGSASSLGGRDGGTSTLFYAGRAGWWKAGAFPEPSMIPYG